MMTEVVGGIVEATVVFVGHMGLALLVLSGIWSFVGLSFGALAEPAWLRHKVPLTSLTLHTPPPPPPVIPPHSRWMEGVAVQEEYRLVGSPREKAEERQADDSVEDLIA